MRVQNPLTYGEKMLSLVLPNEHYTEAKLEKMFGGSEININFPKNIWVHLTYQTAFVDEDGKLQLRKDVYGRDARMIAIIKGSERKVADIAVEQRGQYFVQAGAHAGRHVWRQQQRLQRRPELLRLPVRRRASRSSLIAAATSSARRRVPSTMAASARAESRIGLDTNAGDNFAGVFVCGMAPEKARPSVGAKWYRRVDLNHRPLVPQTSALTN